MAVNGTQTAVVEAAELRKRLIRTAYALHFSAGQTASLFEQFAGKVRLPAELDGLVSAKRWRMLSDGALEIARACDRRSNGTDAAEAGFGVSCNGDASGHPDIVALADLARRHLSAAAMTVEAMLPFVDLPERDRLDGTVETIDATIRELR